MKKLIVLMLVLIPVAVFAAKDVFSAGHTSLARQELKAGASPRQVCEGMEKIVLQLMRQYLSMNLSGELKEKARTDARDLSTIFQTFCKTEW